MLSVRKIFFLLLILLSADNLKSQNLNIDSIKNIIKTDLADTNNVRHLLDLAWELSYINPDTSIIVATKALELSKKLQWNDGIATSYHDLASYHRDLGDNLLSLKYNGIALQLWEDIDKQTPVSQKYKINDQIANALGDIGLAYSDQGNYPKALEHLLKALKIAEQYKNEKRMAIQLGNIGIVYSMINEYDKGLDYFNRALKIDTENKNEIGILNQKFNIAAAYCAKVLEEKSDSIKKINYQLALAKYMEVLKMCEKPQFNVSRSTVLLNIGLIYDDIDQSEKAIETYFNALTLDEKYGNKNNIARVYGNIGLSYRKLNKFDLSETYLKKSLSLCDSLGMLFQQMQCEEYMFNLYEKKGDFKQSLQHYKSFAILKDSIFNEEKSQQLTRHEMTYEFEKKEAILKAAQEKKEAVSLANKKRQTIFFWLIASIAIAIGLIAIVIFRSLRLTRFQKQVIESQKELVEEKQKEVLDSIYYARRIQRSLLPTEKYIQKQILRLKK